VSNGLSKLLVGILQFSSSTNVIDNVEKIHRMVRENYREADIVIIPEYSMLNILSGLEPKDVYEKAEVLDNSVFVSKLASLAKELDTHILAHVIERSGREPLSYSSSVLIKPDEGYELVYRKMHLFDAYGYGESKYFIPGNELSKGIAFEGKTFYVAICYDIRFPELFRKYGLMNAYGVFIHAGWVRGFNKELLLDILAMSRSHENTMYLILSNQTGEIYTGRSGVYNPFGYKELDLGSGEKYVEYSIDLDMVDEARKQIPVVSQSRNKWVVEFRK